MNRTKLEAWIEKTEGLPGLTRERLEALQLERLNETLARLHRREGFYKDLPERLGSLGELQSLPFTTPQMLSREPGKFLLTSQAEVCRVISGATSGTTGPAKRVFYTQRDTARTVGFFAAGISEMLSPGQKCFIAFPFTGAFGLGDLIARAVERLGGVSIKAGFGRTWEEWAALVRETKPETYIGFPTALLGLARMYGKDLPIKRALLSGDACPAGVMAELEKTLGSRLFPHYGSRECGLGGAVTCPAFEGMHIRENHILPEIIGEDGSVLPDGEYGELVITTIGADAMPLIRYRTGDFTRILPPCPCGGVTKRIGTVSRREGKVSIEALDSALFPIPGLVDYRAGFDGTLRVEARTRESGLEAAIAQAVQQVYPRHKIQVSTIAAQNTDRPLYLGKRHVLFD